MAATGYFLHALIFLCVCGWGGGGGGVAAAEAEGEYGKGSLMPPIFCSAIKK